MKKLVIFVGAVLCACCAFAQTHGSVNVFDRVYEVLSASEAKGYCKTLYGEKPYSESYILARLDEIEESLEDLLAELDEDEHDFVLETELSVVQEQKKRFVRKEGFDFKNMTYRFENKNEKFPVSFEINDNLQGDYSQGFYSKSDFNSKGLQIYDTINFEGDLTKYFSYRLQGFLGLCSYPLYEMNYDAQSRYYIGSYWYDDGVNLDSPTYGKDRWIHVFRNFSVLPYTMRKFWDGDVYYLTNVSADGLEGWPVQPAMAFGMNGEMRSSFFDNKVELAFGRNNREWLSMDNGASLVLNRMARPFLAVEMEVRPFPWLEFCSLTGVLEYPNEDFINQDGAFNYYGTNNDAYFFQNAYSITMVALDSKYFHFDFGSAVVWPKRFELGYAFPLIDNVVYQNNVGDCDNLCLFGDIMFRNPGVGKFWISGYLDEMPKTNPLKMFKKTRYMFAAQGGAKVVLPFLPFATFSIRYTKVEPYCYTHHSINYTPWYGHYISESYTNNGTSLGYYLQPNSDEFFLRLEMQPASFITCGLQYQLIRHGADYGSRQVPGSNLYSELPNKGRDDLNKYFLKDGCYEWTNIIAVSGDVDLKRWGLPLKMNLSCGYVYDWFTDTKEEIGESGSYDYINTYEYPTTSGFVFSIGFSAFVR